MQIDTDHWNLHSWVPRPQVETASRRRGSCLLIIACVSVVTIGCSGTDGNFPVEGTVTLSDGTPLANMRVIFNCEQPPVTATGITDDAGHFVLGTTKRGNGAAVGDYRILVVEAPRGDLPPPSRIDKRYASFQTSRLQFKVEPKQNLFDIQLESVVADGANERGTK